MLLFHPEVPLEGYLERHSVLHTENLSRTACFFSPAQWITPLKWCVYFLAYQKGYHSMLAWEGIFNNGQRILRVAHLTAPPLPVFPDSPLLERVFPLKQIHIGYETSDYRINLADEEKFHETCLRERCVFAAFSAHPKNVKEMEAEIDFDENNPPEKYKAILSSESTVDEKDLATNCQRWALEKLEKCLGFKQRELQARMSPLPSRTASALQSMSRHTHLERPHRLLSSSDLTSFLVLKAAFPNADSSIAPVISVGSYSVTSVSSLLLWTGANARFSHKALIATEISDAGSLARTSPSFPMPRLFPGVPHDSKNDNPGLLVIVQNLVDEAYPPFTPADRAIWMSKLSPYQKRRRVLTPADQQELEKMKETLEERQATVAALC